MAAGAWQVFGAAIEGIAERTVFLDTAGTPRLRMVLVTESYTPNLSTHTTWGGTGTPSTFEVANGGGYTTHGKLLATTVTRSGLTVTFDCDDQSWTSSTITAKYAVIVQDADANGALVSGDLLVCYSDLSDPTGSVSTTNGTFAVNINASGVFTIAQA